MHKYIALPGTLSEKAQKALKLWLIGEFYHVELKELSPEGYHYIKDLAHGANGVTSIVETEQDGMIFICKRIDIGSMKTKKERDNALREFRIQDQLDHEHIIKCERKGTLIEPGKRIQMIQEFADRGDLESLRLTMKGKSKFSECFVRQLIVQLFQGLAFTHARGVIHRDIKAANVLLMANGDLKICDFGIAVMDSAAAEADAQGMEKTAKSGSGEGSYVFMAPEILLIVLDKPGKPAIYDSRIDNWSAGAMFFQLLKGGIPFHMNSDKVKWATDPDAEPIRPLPNRYTKELREFVMALLNKDPKLRPSSKQVLLMPFLQSTIKALEVRKDFLAGIKPVSMKNIEEISKYKRD